MGSPGNDPTRWMQFQASSMANIVEWEYLEDGGNGWPGVGWIRVVEGGDGGPPSLAFSTAQATQRSGHVAVYRDLYLRQGRVIMGGGVGNDSTPLPFDRSELAAHKTTDDTPVVIHSYTPPEGSVVTITWEVVARQTLGTGSPRGAVWHLKGSWRRAGDVLTPIDGVEPFAVAGKHNESGNEERGVKCLVVANRFAALQVIFTGVAAQTWEARLTRDAVEGGGSPVP